jgi:hypothetical protein
MSSDKAVVDSEPVAFTKEEARQILHQFAKEIGSFELDFYNFDELNYRLDLRSAYWPKAYRAAGQ